MRNDDGHDGTDAQPVTLPPIQGMIRHHLIVWSWATPARRLDIDLLLDGGARVTLTLPAAEPTWFAAGTPEANLLHGLFSTPVPGGSAPDLLQGA